MKDLIIRIDEPKKTEIFEKVEDADLLIKQLEVNVNQKLYEKAYGDVSLASVLGRIADDIEKATGERPVFGPWHSDYEGLFQIEDRLLDFKSINDYEKIIIDWPL